jgi:iron(III) transport system ATP-binding protein
MSQLKVTDLHFSRGDNPILRGVSFEHERGKILTFLGPSGCGKTTLLWLLAGLLKQDLGRIEYPDSTTPRSPGMVFQDGGLWEHLSVRKHLEVVLRGRGLMQNEITGRVEKTLSQTNLQGFASRRPGELSGGERQRLALARAMVVEPQWLLLDEPTSQLDGPARQQMVELLANQLRATSAGIIVATHQVDLAIRLSDEIAILRDGVIAQMGPVAEVYERPANLAVAQLLGPASEIACEAVRGLPSSLEAAHVLFRPYQVRFHACDDGAARVVGCHFAGAFWAIEVETAAREGALASSVGPIPIGTSGELQWVSG